MHAGLPVADNTLAAALYPATEALVAELVACSLDVPTTLDRLAGLAADFENNRQLAERAATLALGHGGLGDAATSRLAGSISDLEAAWLRVQPNLVDELAVRGKTAQRTVGGAWTRIITDNHEPDRGKLSRPVGRSRASLSADWRTWPRSLAK